MSSAERTVQQRWQAQLRSGTAGGITVPGADGGVTLPLAELLGRAATQAAAWRGLGVQRGDSVLLCLPSGGDLLTGLVAAVLLHAVPSVLAPPNARMSAEAYGKRIAGIAKRFAGDRRAWCVARQGADIPGTTALAIAAELSPSDPTPWLADHPDPEAPVFLQHSSGTTGVPKGVVISHRKLIEHLDAYGSHLGVTAADRIVSWLPWYHDMGMVACLWGSLIWGVSSRHLDNFTWVTKPTTLLDAVESDRATLVWMPNFAYTMMGRGTRDRSRQLQNVRLWINCAEPVLADSFAQFAQRFAADGVDPASLVGCYGMAENVFAVTQAMQGGTALRLDRVALEQGRIVTALDGPARTLLSCGTAIPGTTVAVLATGQVTTAENQVGELLIGGAHVCAAYWRDPEASAAARHGDWFRTGDLGFVYQGEVYVIGRSKDLIIVGGRNADPTEIEMAATLPGAIPGRVCCFGIDEVETGTQAIHVAVETELPQNEHGKLILAIKQAVLAATDHAVRQVWCLPPRTLVKSSSGKLARAENRNLVLKIRQS
ncbi:MAG: AMP-binding protein [Planctomycetota bacterium]